MKYRMKFYELLPIFFIILALIIPFAFNLHFSGGFSWNAIIDNASKIRFTIFQALLSSVLTALLGLPGAYLLGRTHMHPTVKRMFRVMSSVPFVLPGITMSIGFFLTFGKNGIYMKFLNLFGLSPQILYTFTAVLLGHVFYNFPLFIRIVGEAWEGMDGHIIEAAKIDGADRWQLLRNVEFPLLMPSILRAFFLTYIYTFTSFSVVMILGGIKYSTIEVAIYMYSRITFDFKAASSLMLFQLLFISIIGLLTSVRRSTYERNYYRHLEKFPKWGYVFMAISSVLIFIPVVYSGLSGFLDYYGNFSMMNFSKFFSENIEYLTGTTIKSMVFYTVLISVSASLISICINLVAGYYASRGRKLSYVVIIPAALSSVTIAFSYVLLDIPVLLKIILTHTLITLPITFGIIESSWRNVSQSVIDAAKVDGAGMWSILWKVVIPLMKTPLLSAFVYACAISVGETSATLMLAEPPITTFAAVVFRLMSSRNTEIAMVLNTFYFLFVISLFVLTESLRREEYV